MKRILILLALAFLPSPAIAAQAPEPVMVARAPSSAKALEGTVVSNHDGDTITVRLDSGKTEKVRLLGIDTAEIAQGEWGIKARDFLKRMVQDKRVRLELDVQERDRYGRVLAYAYTQDGTFVNLELVKQGYAMLLTYPPNVAHVSAFQAAQTQARNKGLNIWSANGLKQSPKDFRANGNKNITRGEGMQVQTAPKSSAAKPAAAAHRVSMNVKSRKYHKPSCRHFDCGNCEQMSLANAQSRGGVPCKVCH